MMNLDWNNLLFESSFFHPILGIFSKNRISFNELYLFLFLFFRRKETLYGSSTELLEEQL